MAYIVPISDLTDPGLGPYAHLTEAQLRSRRDPNQGLFIAESAKVISCALDAGYEPVSLLMEEKKLAPSEALLARCGEIPVYVGARELLSSLTGYALTRGILCAMRRRPLPETAEITRSARRLAVLEGIVDPTNVGAIFRSAAALGMDGVLLTPTCCDPLHRRAVRVSMGTVFQIPWAYIGQSPADWPENGLRFLRESGFRTAALALSPEAVSIEDPRLRQEERLALILGTEGDGLSPETVRGSDYTVIIPMSHGVDSLNVSAAGAVAFWTLGRH